MIIVEHITTYIINHYKLVVSWSALQLTCNVDLSHAVLAVLHVTVWAENFFLSFIKCLHVGGLILLKLSEGLARNDLFDQLRGRPPFSPPSQKIMGMSKVCRFGTSITKVLPDHGNIDGVHGEYPTILFNALGVWFKFKDLFHPRTRCTFGPLEFLNN